MSVRAVLFDVFGTLLDVHSVGVRADQLFPGHGQRLSQLWREKQIEYTRLRTMSSRYVPFTQVTEDALQFACEALRLPLDAAARGLLMH
jgi:2-haloacid dehalogenase